MTQLRKCGYRLTAREMIAMAVAPEVGFEFDTDLLDLRLARYRVATVNPGGGCVVNRVAWLAEATRRAIHGNMKPR